MIGSILQALGLCVIGAMIWQHRRYEQTRRTRVLDRQALFYPGQTFHAVTFVKVAGTDDVIERVRELRVAIEASGSATVVYAGQVGATMVESAQLSNDWSAVVLAQYPSREDFDRSAEGDEYLGVLSQFQGVYTHGVKRSAAANALIPIGLLSLRIGDMLRFAPSAFPFIPAGEDAIPKLKAKLKDLEGLSALRHVKDDAVVIFNLIKPGNKEQRAADRGYSRQMMSGMAEGGYGPTHLGAAITLEGDAQFKMFGSVYYPGIDFVIDMVGSTFMNRVGVGKQLGDSLAVATVPILDRL